MRALLIGIGCAVVAVVLLALSGWPASRYLHGDYIQYWLASRALFDGWDPYDPAVWRAMHERVVGSDFFIAPGAGFSYPLTTAVATLPFAVLGVAQSAPLWFVAQAGTAIAGLVALQRRVAPRWTGRQLALLFALCALIQPVFVLGGDGNIVRFLPGILAFGLALLASGSAVAAGAVLGLCVVKPQLFLIFGPALLLLIAPSLRLRFVAGAAATVGALLAISLALRPTWIQAWLAQSVHVQGLYGHDNLWGDLGSGPAAWAVAAVAVLAVLAWWWVRRPPFLTAAAVALALSLYLAPYATDYDRSILLVCLLAYLVATDGLAGPTRVLLVVLFVATAAINWPVWLGIIPAGWQSDLPAPAAVVLLVLADLLARRAPSVGPSAASRGPTDRAPTHLTTRPS